MSTQSVRRALRVVTQMAAAASLVAVVATQAHAQGGQPPVTKDQPTAASGPGGGGGRGGRMMQAMLDSLNLTPAQRQKVDSINAAFQAKMPAFTPGQPPSDEDRQKRQQVMSERTAAIKAVLTPEQVQKYDAMMEAMRSRMGGGRPPAGR
jgi:Spy/CpxP family protein refolding chaperone